ncbi:hypothetical protein, partial [uncultured Bacteroides sp.]|uniref:hypothetical protein n=2 Tax=uncultured Bacteroides sp. TaxID=162156 RepID=UPI0025934045
MTAIHRAAANFISCRTVILAARKRPGKTRLSKASIEPATLLKHGMAYIRLYKTEQKTHTSKIACVFCFPFFLLPTDFAYLCPQEEKMKIFKAVASIVNHKIVNHKIVNHKIVNHKIVN